MLAHTVRVYYLREELFTHTTLSGDKNGKVGLGHLNCRVYSSQKLRIISYDAELLLHPLYLGYIHSFLLQNEFLPNLLIYTQKQAILTEIFTF